MKKLSIIILSYNVETLLLDCLRSLPHYPDWEVIVVDNASTDSSVASVRKNFPLVKIISNPANLGFAAGNNVALSQCTSPYILLLNPDTVVYPRTIETVFDYVENHPDVGAATCRVELADGSLDYSCHRGFPDPVGALLHFLGLKQVSKYSSVRIPSGIHEIDALTGAFALLRTSAGRQLGWFDQDYFWNGEDIDLCFRLKEAGWKIMYLPDVKITHYKGASAKATRDSRLRWAYNSTTVMSLFYRKHLARKYPFLLNQLVYLGISLLRIYRLAVSAL